MLRQPVYTFLFDRRSLTLLLAGTVASAVLLFVGGLLVGLKVNLDERTVAAVADLGPRHPTTVPATAGGGGAAEAAAAGAAAAGPATDAAGDGGTTDPGGATSGGATRGGRGGGDTGDGAAPAPPGDWVPLVEGDPWPGPAAQGAAAAPAPRPALPAIAALPAPPQRAPEPTPAARAVQPPPPRLAGQPPVAPEIAAFTVQVAAFAVEGNARRLVDRLARRGYEPYVVELGGGRLLAVRFGRYADADEARRAAAGFRTSEGAEAIVVTAAT